MDNQEKNSFKSVKSEKDKYSIPKGKVGFFRGFFIPFIAGTLGSLILVGTVLTIPSVKEFIAEKLLEDAQITETKSDGTQTTTIFTPSSSTQISLEEYSKTSIGVANKVLPSVVGIKITYSVSSPYYAMYGMSAQTATGTGSGVIISEDGYILTNNHVVSSSSSSSYYQVSQATSLTVTLYGDTTEYEARVIGTDAQTDLAVLKIAKTGLTAAELGDSDSLEIGEFAMAIGNPLNMPSTVTTGIISAKERSITTDGTTYKVIQTDAAINSGNSGGALINAEGKVIGINTLKLSGSGIEGMGFAIPINATKSIYQELITNGKVARPTLGITGRTVSETTAKQNNLKQAGVYVVSVNEFSSAEKAGIEKGDLIVEFDGQKITTMDELNNVKNSHSIGDEVKIKLYRNNEEKEITIKLEEGASTQQEAE